jgi:hypothetical protein
MQHQLQMIAYAGNDVELSQVNKRIPYPCIHFKHLADELVSETTKRQAQAHENFSRYQKLYPTGAQQKEPKFAAVFRDF